ncbi:class I adenylate-forming enzyme family protein [Phenylobacterium montanum]|uniref:Acyl--CoA ligase n=1 Tax=Phenylobacterium montanum TaxID=2823693 RepID=A0A975G2V5_9CAUL|nr:class I adenylate-forming enzyme family protein [Caulobacter sp. S6]QUD89487.1 acyl--CoA ligase [Caulobacter sp. S6]
MFLTPAARIATYREQGVWGDLTIDDLTQRNRREVPGRLALADPPNRVLLDGCAPRRLTWDEAGEAVDRLASAFLGLGLAKDDIVCIQSPNTVDAVLTFLACARIGLICCPVVMQYRAHELGYILDLVKPAAVVTPARFSNFDHGRMMLALTAGSPTKVLVLGGDVPEGAVDLDAARAAADPAVAAAAHVADPPQAGEVATICWTSGTEARPKGVPRDHNHWIVNAQVIVAASGLLDGETLLNPFPLVNIGSIGGLVMPWLWRRGTLVLHHPFDLGVFLGQIAAERVNYTIAPPAILTAILKTPALKAAADLSSVRAIGSGSAPLSPWMIEGFLTEYGIQICNYFGSNEGASLYSSPAETSDPDSRAHFFPRFGADGIDWDSPAAQMIRTRLVDLAGDSDITEPGKAGELRIDGAMVFSGYFRSPALNAAAFDERGYFRTGDLFEIAGEGPLSRYYRFVGRCKEIIIRGGMNISPAEIDDLLAAHPDLRESAVVGVPDEALGERVCLAACPIEGRDVDLPAVCNWLRAKGLATFKLPERMVVVDALPRSAMNKVLRNDLRAQVLAALDHDEFGSNRSKFIKRDRF